MCRQSVVSPEGAGGIFSQGGRRKLDGAHSRAARRIALTETEGGGRALGR